MTIRLAENIRAFRKERKLTQEQLAEALGVTVGAVSKWESGASTPDISLIVGMAGFFDTSVDVLLGYDWRSGGMGEAVERIRTLRNAKHFSDAADEAEKALKKYPNSFDVAFQSAVLYSMKGIEQQHPKSFRRSLALFERALELVAQNTNERINEWTIRNNIAEVHLCLGQTQTALEQMKSNNADGLNNGSIGYTLASVEKKPDEALPYLSDALVDHVTKLYRVIVAYANAYEQRKEYAAAADALLFMRGVIAGLKRGGRVTYLDRAEAQLLAAATVMSAKMGDLAVSREYLQLAKRQAELFDASPGYGFSDMRFFHGDARMTAFDDFGATALEGVLQTITQEDAPGELSVWWAELNG